MLSITLCVLNRIMPYLDNIVIMLQQASYSMEISSTKKNVTMVVKISCFSKEVHHNKVEWLYNISF